MRQEELQWGLDVAMAYFWPCHQRLSYHCHWQSFFIIIVWNFAWFIYWGEALASSNDLIYSWGHWRSSRRFSNSFGYFQKTYLCLVILQVPKCFVLVQTFCARPKNELHLVLLQKILCRLNNWIYWMEFIFWSGTKSLGLAQYLNPFYFFWDL